MCIHTIPCQVLAFNVTQNLGEDEPILTHIFPYVEATD